MRNLILILFALIFTCSTFASNLSRLEQDLEALKSRWDTLDEKQQKAVKTLEKYYEYKILSEDQKRSIERKRVEQREEVSPGVYVDVELENQNQFAVRQTARIDFEEVITDFFGKYCLIPFCAQAITDVLEDLLPELVMVQSLEGQATGNAGKFDLLIHFLAFPGSIQVVNELIHDLFNVAVNPSTSVSYFTASASYNANFTSASLDFSIQAFSVVQSYSSLIEYNDLNGNKIYDQGEEVKVVNLGTAAWNPTTYRPIDVGTHIIHEIFTSTKDNVVRFFCDTSSFPLKDENGQVVNPNASKCSINIRNFVYSQNNTFLAMKANVALVGGKFGGVVDGVLSITPGTSSTRGGYFSWVEDVDVNGQKFSVSAQGLGAIKSDIVDFNAMLTTFANGDYEVDAKEMVFSFQTNPNPTFIFWDPSVSYGEVPIIKKEESSASSIVFSSALLLVLLMTLFF